MRTPPDHRRRQRGFIGRARELCELEAERHRSALGELRVALVLGDAGLGKTRLASELLPDDDEPTLGLTTRSSRLRGMPSFNRWAQTLSQHVRGPADSRAWQACENGLGDQSALLHGVDLTQDVASRCPDQARHRLVERVVDLLTTLSADRPVVVVLDDAHWGEDALWEMLLLLSSDCPKHRLFVLITARPGQLAQHRNATEVLSTLEQQGLIHRVQLGPLTAEDVRELAATLVPQHVPSALVERVIARSQGVPMFAVRLLEALAEEDADLTRPEFDSVPRTLADWVRTEVMRLDPASVPFLELLAVVGGPLDLDDLAQIAGTSLEEISLPLEQLVRSGMVLEQGREGSLSYAVTHTLVREVLDSCVEGTKRRVWNQRAARTRQRCESAEASTSHAVRSARAVGHAVPHAPLGDAEQTERRELSAVMSRVVDVLPTSDLHPFDVPHALSRRPDGHIAYGTEHHGIGEVGVAALRRMQQQLTRTGDLHAQASVGLRLTNVLVYETGDLVEGERECQQAIARYQQAGYEPESRIAAIELAKIRGWTGDLPGQALAAQQVLHEAEQARDQRGTVRALGTWGTALAWQGNHTEAESVLIRGLQLATAANDPSGMSQSLTVLTELDACQGRMVSARSRWAQAAASIRHHDMSLCRSGALIAWLAGDLAAVHLHARYAGAHHPGTSPPVPNWVGAMAAMAAAERGQLTEARQRLDGMAPTPQNRRPDLFSLFRLWAEGVVSRAEGRLATATTAFQQAIDGYLTINARALTGFVLVDLAETAVTAGDHDTATRTATQAQDNAHHTGAPSHHALHQLTAAWTLLHRSRHSEAALAAARAADGFHSSGYALLRTRAQVAYARSVIGYDRPAAIDTLREAATGCDACGAVLRSTRTRQLLTQLQSDKRHATSTANGTAALTEREHEIAELAAHGFTARSIAERLCIGARTVETHLAHIYPKLGITSKQQLVRRAADLGLTPKSVAGP
jgi:DNA-binding CsgD family transcriptional regulator